MRRLLRLIVIRLAMTEMGVIASSSPPVIASLFFHVIASPFLHVITNPFLHVIASSSLSVIARSEATKQSPLLLHPVIANRRGWQVCWSEAISPLHIPVSVGHSEEIASLTTFARNDGVGL